MAGGDFLTARYPMSVLVKELVREIISDRKRSRSSFTDYDLSVDAGPFCVYVCMSCLHDTAMIEAVIADFGSEC